MGGCDAANTFVSDCELKRTVNPREKSRDASQVSSVVGRDQSVLGQLSFSKSSECFQEECLALDKMGEGFSWRYRLIFLLLARKTEDISTF